jgi:ferredoxin--NADP+ reductase
VAEADGSLRARPTEERLSIPAHAVFRAIGYTGTPLPDVPFDEHLGVIANAGGRVVGPDGVRRGEYVVGWAKRGPSGVIGTNKKDAHDTVERQPSVVDYADWARIDSHERKLGEDSGRPRRKLTRVQEMLAAAKRR